MAAFEELGVMPEISRVLEGMDWILPTEIQSEAIPMILGGGDILMASETGTGKTGAFCIPILQSVYEQILNSKKTKNRSIKPVVKDQAWSLSAIDRARDVVLDRDFLHIQSKSGTWQGCRANKGVKQSSGKSKINSRAYYEVHFDEQGLARLGWSLAKSSLDLGTDRDGWGYGGTAKRVNNRQFDDYGDTFGEKFDIVGCIFDLTTGELSFTKNGRNQGIAFKIPNQLFQSKELYPTICIKNAGCRLRFGSSPDVNDHKPTDCTWVEELSQELIISRSHIGKAASLDSGPFAIIMEPSRELAKQTFDYLQTFSTDLGIKCQLLVGGENKTIQDRSHIVVCTPGRISEVNTTGKLSFDNVHFFILDEADAILQQGHHNVVRTIHSSLNKMFESGRRLQTICCSATLHDFEVKKLAQQLMHFPIWIDLKGEDTVPESVHHVVLRVDPRKGKNYEDLEGAFKIDGVHPDSNLDEGGRMSRAVKLLKFYYTLRAIETLKMDQGVIFCRTKLDCDHLHDFMSGTGGDKFTSVRLHSGLTMKDRQDNLLKFKSNHVRFLICTDVAARGIDVRGVPYLIQVTLPDEPSNYIHRIGRVGRAERMGLAISLVANVPEKVWYHKCNKRECHNTKGCTIWQDELTLLAEIENHLKCTIQEVESDFKLQVDEFDGHVVYGAKKLEQASTYQGHVEQLKSMVTQLSELEYKLQQNYLHLYAR